MSSSPPIHAHIHQLSFSSSNTGSPTWHGYGSGNGSGTTLSSGGYGYGYGSASEGRRLSGSGFGGGNGGVWGARYGGGSGGGNSNGNSGGNRSSGAGHGDDVAGRRRHEEELINAYEAEEERITNVLSRKLEKLREDKIDLENALEAESENHVNRMMRELSKLRQANADLEARLAREATETQGKGKEKDGLQSVKENNLGGNSTATNRKNGESSGSRERRDISRNSIVPPDPEPSLLLDALRRENEELRARLGRVEKDYVRVKRLNEVYREELIVRRGRLGLPVDNLIGLTPSDRDPFEQPTHHRRESSASPFPQRKNLPSTSHRGYSSASSWSELDVEGVDVEGRIGGTADDEKEEEDNDVDTGQNLGDYYNGSSTSYVPKFLSNRGGYASRNPQYRNNTSTTTTAHGRGIPIRRVPSQTRIRRPNLTVDAPDGMMGEHAGVGGLDLAAPDMDELQLPSTPVSPVVPLSSSTTSTSTSDSVSPFPFSPVSLRSGIEIGRNGGGEGGEGRGRSGRIGGVGNSGAGGEPASYVSTDVTSPESGPESFPAGLLGGLGALPGAQGQNGGVGLAGLAMSHTGIGGYGVPQRGLSYPSVPPPSLSSSLGSELDVLSRSNSRRGSNAGLGVGSRRGSNAGVGDQPRRVVEAGSLRRPSASGGSSPQPLPIGGRVAETGSLLRNNRSRAGSLSVGYVPSTVDEGEGEEDSR